MSTVYIQKESVNHIILNNDTGSDLEQYEATVIGNLALIADEAIADGETGSFHVEEGIIFQTDDLETGEDTFATESQIVYWNPATGDFSDTETLTYYPFGILYGVKDANGMILVSKYRVTELMSENDEYIAADVVVTNAFVAADVVVTTAFEAADAILRAVPKILVVEVAADYSGGVAVVGLVEGDKIIGMKSNCNVTETAGTIALTDGADAAITDALQQATDKEVAYAATIDKTYSTLPATGAKLIATGTDATAVRCTVVIEYIPA